MSLGSGIRDPGSGINLFRIPDPGSRIPDPGSRGQKAPNPGSRIRIRNTAVNSKKMYFQLRQFI
jgi:hypothetical protein